MCERSQCIARCFVVMAVLLAGCEQKTTAPTSPAARRVERTPSLPVEAMIDLGVILQGESSQINQWVRNQSDTQIEVAKVEKSCECLDIRLDKQQFKAGERTLCHLSYDGAKEPDFVGSLQIEITLLAADGQKVGLIQVPVQVIPKPEPSNP